MMSRGGAWIWAWASSAGRVEPMPRSPSGWTNANMPGSSIMCCADAGDAISAETIATAPRSLNLVIVFSSCDTPPMCGSSGRKTGLAAPAFRQLRSRFGDQDCTKRESKQRRHPTNLQGSEKHRAIDEAQPEGARLLAFEHRFGTKRVDARGNADIGVLLDGLAEPWNGAIEGAEQIVEILRLDAGRDAIERGLRHALFQHLVDAERRNHLLDARDRHLQFTVDPAVRIEAQRAGGHGDQIALLNPRTLDLDMAACGLHLTETFRPRLWRKILQA